MKKGFFFLGIIFFIILLFCSSCSGKDFNKHAGEFWTPTPSSSWCVATGSRTWRRGIVLLDLFRFLGNWPLTCPLSQNFALNETQVSMPTYGSCRWGDYWREVINQGTAIIIWGNMVAATQQDHSSGAPHKNIVQSHLNIA